MPDKPEQKLLPFDEVAVSSVSPPLAAVSYEPSAEALAAYQRLEGWLLDGRGRPVTDAAGDALAAVRKALVEGKNAWFHAAEERLEALLACPDLAGVRPADGREFRELADELLDCLHERFLSKGDGRPPPCP